MPRTFYQWQEEELAVLRSLNLTLSEGKLDRKGFVRRVVDEDGATYVAKLMGKDSLETKALRKIHAIPSLRDRIVPGTLYDCETLSVLIMPFLDPLCDVEWAHAADLEVLLEQMYKILDTIRILHENDVAFIDIDASNLVWSKDGFSHGDYNIPAGTLYLIDLGSVRLLPSGPNTGVKIHDFRDGPGKRKPPEGIEALDPYAYDIYMLGHTLHELSASWCGHREASIPRCLGDFCLALFAKDPLQRPTISQARRQFIALKAWILSTKWTYRVFSHKFADNFEDYGWRLRLLFVRR